MLAILRLRARGTGLLDLRGKPVKLQHHLHCDNPLQFVHVRAADHRQRIHTRPSHAFQRDGERVIRMQMRKLPPFDHNQLLGVESP